MNDPESGTPSLVAPAMDSTEKGGSGSARHCHFVLLAEFNIDKGSTLSYQYPAPLEHDDHMLAELMLPDGAHARAEDWTVFFLDDKRPLRSLAASQSSTDPDEKRRHSKELSDADEGGELTHVLNLVRTKHDNTVRRGALVRAMAIGTSHPWIQVFKPVLQLALDDFFAKPREEPLSKLYEAINSLDLSAMPKLSRDEKLILRASDSRDLFAERFEPVITQEESARPTVASKAFLPRRTSAASLRQHSPSLRRKPSASAKAALDSPADPDAAPLTSSQSRPRKGSWSAATLFSGMAGNHSSASASVTSASQGALPVRDTHFYETSLAYQGKSVLLRIPLHTFPEEVGDYSLMSLHSAFCGTSSVPSGPMHGHLHSNGSQTPALIMLFNAVATGKRVIFLGHGQPANTVATHVLSACALASGGGAVFRGLTRRAFPYCNLGMMDELERTPGYIAGVTNPRFEDLHAWDVLYNTDTGKVTVAKDVEPAPPLRPHLPPQPSRGTFSSGSITSMAGSTGLGHDALVSGAASSDYGEYGSQILGGTSSHTSSAFVGGSSIKSGSSKDRTGVNIETRPDAQDVLFIEELQNAAAARCGDRYLLARWTDFAFSFARAVAKHQEQFYGHITIGLPPSQPFLNGQLGSGAVYPDRDTELKEISANNMRAAGWLTTDACRLFRAVSFRTLSALSEQAIVGYDVQHQVQRLKRARHMSAAEAELIFATLSSTIRTPKQITEFLALHAPHTGSLSSIAVGLLHPSSNVRGASVELLSSLCTTSLGRKFVQSLNIFHRLAFARQLTERERAQGLTASHSSGAEVQDRGALRLSVMPVTPLTPGFTGGAPFSRTVSDSYGGSPSWSSGAASLQRPREGLPRASNGSSVYSTSVPTDSGLLDRTPKSSASGSIDPHPLISTAEGA
ncbi:spindle pole body interacting protein [Ceraceosorus guamensis]|uniref:Spindle pole body interacting protein n=1 Tax=Ceraceosorus guamensis TaxID=1522189 RepID=A0A316W3N3_9BASI|nr:spindle pole body interacting protein [Ceraceosorus guamensis]PWN44410.1 spindle pole body interacting protein [Ceraceosorus guamensis]